MGSNSLCRRDAPPVAPTGVHVCRSDDS
jgi:hypothetical protein